MFDGDVAVARVSTLREQSAVAVEKQTPCLHVTFSHVELAVTGGFRYVESKAANSRIFNTNP